MHKGGVTEQNNIELFVYGTLLLEETWHMLIARAPRLTPAKIKGFRRYKVKGAPYPGLWHDPSSQIVLGAVVELSKEERMGPGGLDPVEVFETLPDSMKEAFESQEIQKLHVRFYNSALSLFL